MKHLKKLILALFTVFFASTAYCSQQTTPVMGTYVGELHEQWQFPSDHLPIGITVDNVHIMSWNVLDSAYIGWVLDNSQGLSHSMITDLHVYIDDTKLTVRDQVIVSLITDKISDRGHSCSVMSLQECGRPFLKELQARLPKHWELISHGGQAVLIDQTKVQKVSARAIAGVFKAQPKRSFQEVVVRRVDNGDLIRLFNAHLPGDPQGPARYEFTQYLAKTFDPDLATIAMGDMNFNEYEMADALDKAFDSKLSYALYSPYCTNIGPVVFESKAIDHFMVHTPKAAVIEISKPEEVLPGVDDMVRLLK